MTNIISTDLIQELRLGRIVYFGLDVTLFDHYSCYEYFATFIKNVFKKIENIQLSFPKWVFPSLQRYIDI